MECAMPKAISVPHKQQTGDYALPTVIAIISMIVLAAFLAASFPAGAFDLDTSTDASQLWAP
jgi:hypothetical protein